MALINCTECNKEISDKADSCPNCGISFNRKENKVKISKKTKIIAIILSIIIILGGIGSFIGYNIYTENRRIAEEHLRAEEEQRLEEE